MRGFLPGSSSTSSFSTSCRRSRQRLFLRDASLQGSQAAQQMHAFVQRAAALAGMSKVTVLIQQAMTWLMVISSDDCASRMMHCVFSLAEALQRR